MRKLDVVRLSAAVLVLLEVGLAVYPFPFLPLGGSHLIQMAVIFGTAYSIQEIVAVVRRR